MTVTLKAMQVLRIHCDGNSLRTPSLTCRADWGNSTHRLPGGQQRRRRGPQLRSQQRAFQVWGPRRLSRAAASPSASPPGLQTPPLHQVHLQLPSGSLIGPGCVSVGGPSKVMSAH